MRRFWSVALLILIPVFSFSQSNLRVKNISAMADTIVLDSLSIVPGSAFLMDRGVVVDTNAYQIDFVKSLFIWKHQPSNLTPQTDSLEIHYRVFPFFFSETVTHKDFNKVSKKSISGLNQFVYNPEESAPSFFKYEGLTHSGSIARGITFGNSQDVYVNSSLNLQMAGKLSNDINILAAITDENIPVQPEGNTQQLQDFDKVFIQLYNDRSKLIAGDFELRRPDSYFMNFFKKGQGGFFSTTLDVGKKKDNHQQAVDRLAFGIAVSKGKYARNTIVAIEGNQGPYRLTGSNNESFIVVLAGTEKVYLDGELLKRGLQYDYIIDYNTAEITFTAKLLIRKESRITAEFQYSEQSYARSLFFFNDEFENERMKVKFNLYSEQDSKNQPLLLELDSAKTTVMADVGDSIQNAVYPTADSIPFNTNEVLYKKIDSVTTHGTYSGIFVYSTSSDSAHYRVSFSNVGVGNGDYVQDVNSANGKVYRWLQPDTVSGAHLGSYAPVSLLTTPKKQQMFTLGGDVKISKNNTAGVEVAMSNYNVNLFSDKDRGNDKGYATKAYYQNITPLGYDSVNGWKLISNLNYEFVNRDFKPIERYRNVEFERDWNLGSNTIYHDENIASAQVTLSKFKLGNFTYQFKNYEKGSDYRGLMHNAGLIATIEKFNFNASGSLLNTKGLSNSTQYYKHNADLSRSLWKLLVGVRELTEHNEVRQKPADTLTNAGFFFREYTGYISTKDTVKNHIEVNYKKRYDDGVRSDEFKPATEADELNFMAEFAKNPNNQLKFYSSYREMNIKDSTLTLQQPAKTFLNRIDHNATIAKGVVTATTYYEVGTGQDRKLEYYFLQVPAGQGAYKYDKDYNNNGVKDLDEFVLAAYQSEADYIKVFTPTDQYLTTRTNQLNEVLNINPAAAHKSFQGERPLITRFSNQFSIRLDKKTKDEDIVQSLNPFDQKINDSSLVSTNSSYRNTLYFNRSSIVFGSDATWSRSEGKSLLTSGFESHALTTEELNFRWNLTRLLLVTFYYQHGDKENNSEFFPTRNYRLLSNQAEPKLSIQPSTSYRISLGYKYSVKKNIEGDVGEKSTSNNLSMEMKYSAVGKSSFTVKVSYIGIVFNSSENSPLAYDMLEGLHNGTNFTWSAALQRSLGSAIQLSLTYDGRKSESNNPIHTGGMQFRAYF